MHIGPPPPPPPPPPPATGLLYMFICADKRPFALLRFLPVRGPETPLALRARRERKYNHSHIDLRARWYNQECARLYHRRHLANNIKLHKTIIWPTESKTRPVLHRLCPYGKENYPQDEGVRGSQHHLWCNLLQSQT